MGASDLDSLFAHGADVSKDTLHELATLFEADVAKLALVTTACTPPVCQVQIQWRTSWHRVAARLVS